MKKAKNKTKVRDLKPSKDAKGGSTRPAQKIQLARTVVQRTQSVN